MSIYEILPALDLTQSVHAPGGQVKNYKYFIKTNQQPIKDMLAYTQ
jgi:hypothetical protein